MTVQSKSSPPAFVLDGKAIAEGVLARVAEGARALEARGVKPGLAVILVGDDPASHAYVAGKGRAALACGFHSAQHTLTAQTTEAELLALIAELNADPTIHGVLVQLPLPAGLSPARVVEAIAPEKDVDGLHPVNAGLLATGALGRAIIPCTPAGAMADTRTGNWIVYHNFGNTGLGAARIAKELQWDVISELVKRVACPEKPEERCGFLFLARITKWP